MFTQLFLILIENPLLGGISETAGLFMFGLGLIAFAISLRWFFGTRDARQEIGGGAEEEIG